MALVGVHANVCTRFDVGPAAFPQIRCPADRTVLLSSLPGPCTAAVSWSMPHIANPVTSTAVSVNSNGVWSLNNSPG